MPAVNSGKVLVTGANGYVAMWIVKVLLDQGFAVRGTVRAEEKAAHLRSLFKSFGDKFDIVVVEDITKDGAFDDAVKGIDVIAHTASPFHLKADDPAELIGPAVHGTTGILLSVLKHGSSVKRVVITSSCASVQLTQSTDPRIFSEEDWNEACIAEVKEKGRDASAPTKYSASKTLAERAAWEFYEQKKSEVAWDLVVVNPAYVYGPFIHQVDRPENLNESVGGWYDVVVKGKKDNDTLANLGACYVDVRDFAFAHALAVTKPEAAGNRILISAKPFKWQDFVMVAHRLYPQLPAGNTAYDPAKATHYIQYMPDKQRGLLDVPFRTLEETTKDTLEDFKARGWL